jgi:polynucleotide 5'-hydroxyl-kinase GRC3/NOL9
LRCHALAASSPATDPDLYRECAVNLHEYYRQSFSNLTLIINTPGWILGTGLELLDNIISFTSPTEVVYMSEDGPAETVEVLRSAAANGLSTLPSQQAEFTTRTAAHLRAMHTMSYFHTKARNEHEPGTRQVWEAAPLSSVVPWQVRYSGSQGGILAVLSYDYQPPPDLLVETINGMVLAVVEIEDPKAFRGLLNRRSSKPAVSQTPEGLPFIRNPNDIALDPRYSRAIGLVLVRGVDPSTQSLHIITPISSTTIENIKGQGRDIVLVNGKFDAPSWAYTEEMYQRSGFEDSGDKALEIVDDDTSDDDSDDGSTDLTSRRAMGATPWVEVLKGNDKRPVGSKVWRVRRDLGRGAGDG